MSMSEAMQKAVSAVQERFGAVVQVFKDETTLVVSADHIEDMMKTLRDEFAFTFLIDVTAVDYMPAEPRFNVIYHLYAMEKKDLLCVRVPVSSVRPQVPTVEKVFPGAAWFEREVWDMFGIRFEGHHDLRRIVMPADWEGHPLRKDYPLGYEEVQFTFNFNEIAGRKPSPKE